MPDVWMPGCDVDPGSNAGYRSGRNAMRLVKVHKTAGNNSYGVCKNGGLCQWLVPTDGPPWQFAEADSFCYDSGPYNGHGPGIEIEAPVIGGLIRPGLSEFRELTPNQIEWTGRIFRWLHDEWGVPLALYDGPRFQGKGFVGFENHGDLDDQRTDGVTREEWDAMLGQQEADDVTPEQAAQLANIEKGLGGVIAQFGPQGAIEDIKKRIAAIPAGAGGGLSEAQVRAVIRDELNKTKLAG